MVFGLILFSISGGLVILFGIRKKESEISKQIYQRIRINFITSSQRTLCKLSINEWSKKVTSLNATVGKWIIYICFTKFRPSVMSKEIIEM